jgi:type IV fimbrial biogenesis protein FimT
MHRTPIRASSPALRPAGVALHRRRGFTMIELMVVIAVAGIMTALAAPSLTKMIASNRIQSEASTFVGDLMYARSEAIKRGEAVSLCASSDGVRCLNTNTWHSGWIVFSDVNQCSSATTSSTNLNPVRVRARFKGTDTLAATSPSGATNNCISFNRDGLATNLGHPQVLFGLRAATPSDLSTRCVSVELAGRVTTQTTTSDTSCTSS